MFWRTGYVGCEQICGGKRRRSSPEANWHERSDRLPSRADQTLAGDGRTGAGSVLQSETRAGDRDMLRSEMRDLVNPMTVPPASDGPAERQTRHSQPLAPESCKGSISEPVPRTLLKNMTAE